MEPDGDVTVLQMPSTDRFEQGRVYERGKGCYLQDASFEPGDGSGLVGKPFGGGNGCSGIGEF